MTGRPIEPTRIIPAGEPLPGPAAPPPPPPRPPAPPTAPGPEWWRGPRTPAPAPRPPVPVDVHVTVAITTGDTEPAPEPRWWARIRWGYNALAALVALPVSGPWAWVLDSVRDGQSLAKAWVIAGLSVGFVAFLDNARRIQASMAHPDLWAPKWRAALARVLLWAGVEATALTLPVTTLTYLLTGVQPS